MYVRVDMCACVKKICDHVQQPQKIPNGLNILTYTRQGEAVTEILVSPSCFAPCHLDSTSRVGGRGDIQLIQEC